MSLQKKITEKRLKSELKTLNKEREPYYQVIQDKHDSLKFYFLLKGDDTSVYKGGYYLGKIVLPENYPSDPGNFYVLTPSGRFSINKKICLTNSEYHKESWSTSWTIQNMVIGFVSVFLDDNTKGISHISMTKQQRNIYAKKSLKYNMENYKDIMMQFDQFINEDGIPKTEDEIHDFIEKSKIKKIKKIKKIDYDNISYKKWRKYINKSTIKTHDHELFMLGMTRFNKKIDLKIY